MGGENRDMEIADFPRLGKRMVRNGENIEIYNASDAKPFGAAKVLNDTRKRTWKTEALQRDRKPTR
jgi:hypothetical protein